MGKRIDIRNCVEDGDYLKIPHGEPFEYGFKFWGYTELNNERDSRHFLGEHTVFGSGVSFSGLRWIDCCDDPDFYSFPEWFAPFVLSYEDFKTFIEMYYEDCKKYNICWEPLKKEIDELILTKPGYKIITWS